MLFLWSVPASDIMGTTTDSQQTMLVFAILIFKK